MEDDGDITLKDEFKNTSNKNVMLKKLRSSSTGEKNSLTKDDDQVEDVIENTSKSLRRTPKRAEKGRSVNKKDGNKEHSEETNEKIEKKKTKNLFKKSSPEGKTKKIALQNVSFKDLPGSSFTFTYTKPLYRTAILQENIKNAEKQRRLYEYHTKVNAIRASQARGSLHFASEPKPIQSSPHCDKRLRRGENILNGDEKDEPDIDLDAANKRKNIYTSRSGRQIQKRSYLEDSETDSENSQQSFPTKKIKAISDSLKISSLEDLMEDEDFVSSQKVIKKPIKSPLTNEPYKTRSEIMLEKAAEMEEVKEKQENEKDIFEQSFSSLSKYNEQDSNELLQSISDDDLKINEDFPRRRVPPPPGKAKKTYLRKNKRLNSKCKLDMSSCPICGKSFPVLEIERHASNCTNFNDDEEMCPICREKIGSEDLVAHTKLCVYK